VHLHPQGREKSVGVIYKENLQVHPQAEQESIFRTFFLRGRDLEGPSGSHLLVLACVLAWWSGVVVSALALINEVNQRRARLVLTRVTVSGFNSRCRTFISICKQPATQGQLSRPSLRGR